MTTINEILNASPVFNALKSEENETIGTHFEKRYVLTGEIIATTREPAQNYFLLDTAAVLLGMNEGKSVVLNRAGDFIAMELLSVNGVYRTTVSVIENGCIYVIPRERFLDIIRSDSPEAEKIMDAWQNYLNQTAPFAVKIDNRLNR